MRPVRALLSLGFSASLALLACSSSGRSGFDDPALGSSSDAATTTNGGFGDAGSTSDAGDGVCTEDVDVVLVLDVSSSMGFVLDKLGQEFDDVVAASNKLKAGAHFGLVVYVDNAALSATGDQAGGKIHTASTTLDAAFQNAKSTYTTPNRNPGDGPSGSTTQNPICEENALDALHVAATEFPWRPNAARVVILATDDTFLEKGDNYGDRDGDGKTDKTNYPREGDYPAKRGFDETIAALKAARIRVFSFTPLKPPGLAEGCGTGRRTTETEPFALGWSKPWKGKAPIPQQTGGKNFDLGAVKNGSLSLAATINEVVLESRCAEPPK